VPARASRRAAALLPDRLAARAVLLGATALVAVLWAVPALSRPLEWVEDAPGHVAAAQALQERLLPFPGGWDRRFFLGWPQGAGYPPLAHLVLAAVGALLPLGLALRVVLALSALAVPWAAARLARSRGLSPGRAALFALALTGILCLAPEGNGMGLSGSFASSFNVGLLANAVGLPLALLAAAALPRALAGSGGLASAAAACALALLAHLVCGLALLLLAACEVAALLARAPRRSGRVLVRAAALAALVLLLTAAWSWPFLASLGYGAVAHVPAAFPPWLVLALVAGLGAGAWLRRTRALQHRRLSGTLLFLAALAALMALGDLLEAPLHLYRFRLFLVLAALLPLFALPRGRRAVAACGVGTAVLALASAVHGARPASPDFGAGLQVPDALPPGRVLVVSAPGHQPSSHWLELEFPRRAGADALLGLFVESSPLARWVGDVLRAIDPAAHLWGTTVDDTRLRTVARALDAAPAPADAAALDVLRRQLQELGVGSVLTERRLPDALADNAGPVVFRQPAHGDEGGRHEVVDDAYVFRVRALREPGAPAVVLDAPLLPVEWTGLQAWNAAVEPWFFARDPRAPRPVVARAGLDPSPAGPGARVTACETSPDGREIRLQVEAGADVPVVVRTAWHPAWRAEADGRPLPVDRLAPGLCLVRGRGEVRLFMPRQAAETAGAAVSGLAWLGLLAGGSANLLKRRGARDR
jgi:hypothetical protein